MYDKSKVPDPAVDPVAYAAFTKSLSREDWSNLLKENPPFPKNNDLSEEDKYPILRSLVCYLVPVASLLAYIIYNTITNHFSILMMLAWIFLVIVGLFLFLLFPIMVIIVGLITRPRQICKHWKNKLKR